MEETEEEEEEEPELFQFKSNSCKDYLKNNLKQATEQF